MTQSEIKIQAMLIVAQQRLMLSCSKISRMRAAFQARDMAAVVEASGLLVEDLRVFEAAMNETSRLVNTTIPVVQPGPWGVN